MSCADIRELIRRGDALDDAARAHAAGCEGCALAVEDPAPGQLLMGAELDLPDLSEVRSAVLGQVESPSLRDRLQSLATPGRLAVVGVVLAGLAVFTAVASRRGDFVVYPMERWGVEMGALALLLAIAVGAALRPASRPAASRGAERGLAAFLFLVPFGLAILPRAHDAHAASVITGTGHLAATIGGCLAWGSAFGSVLLAAVWMVSRGAVGVPLGRAAIAVTGGAAGLLLLHLHCPITNNVHILLGHTVLPVLFGAIAWVTTRRTARA